MRRFGLTHLRSRSPIAGTAVGAAAVLGLSTVFAYVDPDGVDRLLGPPSSCPSDRAVAIGDRGATPGSGPVALACASIAPEAASCPVAAEAAAEALPCCSDGVSRGALLAASLTDGDAGGAGLLGAAVAARVDGEGGPAAEEVEDVVTFTADVAPLLQKNCQECHRSGQIGPFPLETYEQARKHGPDLATVTLDRRMPPWLAAPDFGDVPFRHDRSLSEAEIETFQAWVDAGMPEGDPDDLPPAPEFSEGWVLGEPDVVISMPEPFAIPAGGDDIYRCFVIPNPLPEDAEVIGIEYRPGNPRVVHHVLGYIDASGKAAELDAGDETQGYECEGGPMIDIRGDLGGWAPGANPDFLPDGIGRILPKGSHIILQVHYHPSGKPETDVTRIGLHLAPKDRPIKKALHWWAAAQMDFTLPAGAERIEVRGDTLPLPCDVEVHAVSPHMHLLGTDMTMYAETPSGDRIDLIRIDHWDFNWQLQYGLERPIFLPEGSVVKVVAHYDNSTDNPNQPRETPEPVGYGEATTDEMCFGFFAATKVGQDLTRGDSDDLHILFREQLGEFERKMREERAQAEEKAAVGEVGGGGD